ncbi:MAG: ATP-dependent Clp protease adaptor ClpS [Deltaproteobacteria bacterium]|nr:ATP-dependent Clp protease adaptor ClpS [Deltaproteobacteria bacterium]
MRDARTLKRSLRKTFSRGNLRHESGRPPHYAVVLHGDWINSSQYIARMLQKTFFYSHTKANYLALLARFVGRCTVWKGPFEIAEMKAYQLRAYGPDPRRITAGARPLDVTLEPLQRR